METKIVGLGVEMLAGQRERLAGASAISAGADDDILPDLCGDEGDVAHGGNLQPYADSCTQPL